MSKHIKRLLSSPGMGGIAAICAVLTVLIAASLTVWRAATWVVQVEARFNALEEPHDPITERVEKSELQDESPADPPQPFSVTGGVRCPGGGDWLGRERNRREGYVEFSAPEGRVIVYPARSRVLSDNDGFQDPIDYFDRDSHGDAGVARASIGCDPPNTPGAGGGWMEIELYGEHRAAADH